MTFVNTRTVAILLSTYNGERYIAEQLDSLLSQTNRDFTIYIRDDGSSDNTPSIIQSFQNKSSQIVIVESKENIGSKLSFLLLMKQIDSKLYMFCDQDDVWMPDKIQLSVEQIQKIQNEYPDKPIIVHTDLQLVDKNLKTIADSYWNFCHMPVDMSHRFELLCHFGDITGCAMIFNTKARDLTLSYANINLPKNIYHDYLVALATSCNNGVIKPIHKTTIKFRRHGDNETNPLSKNKSILSKIYNIRSCYDYVIDQHHRWLFYNNFKDQSFMRFLFYKVKTKLLQNL